MHGLRHFKKKIRHAMHTSFKKHNHVFPPFSKLASIPNITNLLAPSNPDYVGNTTIRNVYEWFRDAISNILFIIMLLMRNGLSKLIRSLLLAVT